MTTRPELPIGTLLRLPHFTPERLAFLKSAGLDCIQVAGVVDEFLCEGPGRARSEELIGMLETAGLTVSSMFLSFAGMQWTPAEVGIIPPQHRAGRMVQACRQMNWGRRYGIRTVICHVGYFPEVDTPAWNQVMADLRRLVSFAGENGQSFLFETAHENATEMLTIFHALDLPNVGMNLDPANALFYDQDDPLLFMERLFPYIRALHCKDAVRPQPGEEHGRETVLGQGDTQFAELLSRLLAKGYDGPLIIERELPPGPEQEKDIQEAVGFIRQIISQQRSW